MSLKVWCLCLLSVLKESLTKCFAMRKTVREAAEESDSKVMDTC